jgi:hypothetical protein
MRFKNFSIPGEIVVANASIDDEKGLNFFPSGIYKHEFWFYNDKRAKIGVFRLLMEIKSGLSKGFF